MLAPAKELVLPHFYPYPKADITPVEQFLVHFQREGIIYPKDALSDAGDATYSKQDTHWTDYGAGIAVGHMLCKLGLSMEEPFPFDFRIVKDAGDLGVKLSTPTDQTLLKVDFSPALQHLVFDNRLKSRGLIQVFQHPEAPLAHSVVVFGDSFAYNMIPYLANAFAKVVYVLSGASIDDEIVAHEQPDLVICEITTASWCKRQRRTTRFRTTANEKYSPCRPWSARIIFTLCRRAIRSTLFISKRRLPSWMRQRSRHWPDRVTASHCTARGPAGPLTRRHTLPEYMRPVTE